MRSRIRRVSSFLATALFAGVLGAAPNPTGVSGTPGNGNTINVTGSGFGLKQSPVNSGVSLPYLLYDFEGGTLGSNASLSAGSDTLGSQNMSVTTESRGASTKDLRSDNVNWAQFSPYGGIVAVEETLPSAGRGGRVFKFQKRKSSISSYTHLNGGVTQFENWKFDRFWPFGSYPNIYNAQNADSAGSCTGGGAHPSPTTEAGSGSNYVRTSSAYRLPGSNWMAEERLIQFNSANNAGDGLYKIRQDGQLNIDRTDLNSDPSSSFPLAAQTRWDTQDDPSNLTDCGGTTIQHDVWYDDLVFDYGPYAWARVLLGNASTLAACTIVEFQPETSTRVNTAATFKERDGELTAATTKYIYVFDKDDNVNASGLLLQAGAGNPPPTVSTFTTSTCTYSGSNNTETLTGTGFITGGTVQFGTMTAVSTIFVNSTHVTCHVPAGPGGTTVDLVYFNADGQSARLSGAITYTNYPGTPIYRDGDPIRDDGKRFPLR